MLESLTPPKRKFSCKVKTLHEDFSKDDQARFMAAIDQPDLWPAKTLSNELAKLGVRLVDTSITKHRQKSCSCFRDR